MFAEGFIGSNLLPTTEYFFLICFLPHFIVGRLHNNAILQISAQNSKNVTWQRWKRATKLLLKGSLSLSHIPDLSMLGQF